MSAFFQKKKTLNLSVIVCVQCLNNNSGEFFRVLCVKGTHLWLLKWGVSKETLYILLRAEYGNIQEVEECHVKNRSEIITKPEKVFKLFRDVTNDTWVSRLIFLKFSESIRYSQISYFYFWLSTIDKMSLSTRSWFTIILAIFAVFRANETVMVSFS